MEDLAHFGRLVAAIRPWLPHLVVVGGWAYRLYRFHGSATPPRYLPLRTRDTDLAFSPDALLEGNLSAALKQAGFNEEFLGDNVPPATHYRLGDDAGAFYAEFLTPLYGSGLRQVVLHLSCG